jgi:predicted dehydrogenase
MEALWTRYLPIYKVVRKWLDEKLIGDVKLLTSTFGYAFERNLTDRKFNHELAGGALLDLGIYPIAISQWVLRKNPESFTANGYLGETNVDEMTAVNLNYGNGVISQFTCNMFSTNENDFLIYGSKGYIRIHKMFWGATKATLYLGEKEITEEQPLRASGFEYQIEEAMNCIKSGKIESDEMTHERTLANMELMDKIRNQIGLKYSFE